MLYKLHIPVRLGGSPAATGDVVLSNSQLFAQLRRSHPDNSINPSWFKLQIAYDEAMKMGLLGSFRSETGKRPSTDYNHVLKNPDKYYYAKVERIIEAGDLDAAPWLYLIAPGRSLADFKAVEPDDSYVVAKVTNKKKIAFGCTRTVGWMMLFSEALKDKFLDSRLRGIGFQPVKLGNGSRSGLWQISTPARMPPLAMTLTDGQGNAFAGDESRACCVDEGSYFPMVLKYQESALMDVPEMDVLMSAERMGGAHNAHRMHIVSQRFRQVAEKLAPGQFSYGLVAIGEGRELQERFMIPELMPPTGTK